MHPTHVTSESLPCHEVLVTGLTVELNRLDFCLVDPRLLGTLRFSDPLAALQNGQLRVRALAVDFLEALQEFIFLAHPLSSKFVCYWLSRGFFLRDRRRYSFRCRGNLGHPAVRWLSILYWLLLCSSFAFGKCFPHIRCFTVDMHHGIITARGLFRGRRFFTFTFGLADLWLLAFLCDFCWCLAIGWLGLQRLLRLFEFLQRLLRQNDLCRLRKTFT